MIGGRLDYIDHRPVAAMVYRHGLHPINLFVWADPSKTAGQPSVTSRQGYNIRHWVEGDLTYWLISDVEADQLDGPRNPAAQGRVVSAASGSSAV